MNKSFLKTEYEYLKRVFLFVLTKYKYLLFVSFEIKHITNTLLIYITIMEWPGKLQT